MKSLKPVFLFKNHEQLKLIDASTAMYQRFLKQDYTEKQVELLKHLAMPF